MISWKETESDLKLQTFEALPWGKLKLSYQEVKDYVQQGYYIFFDEVSWELMWNYGKSHATEVGGLLLGYCFEGFGFYVWLIDDIVCSEVYESSEFHLVMYPEIWQEANKKIKDTERIILGWFHTHPNFQPFFSGTDQATQREYFRFPFSLGFVFDPFSGSFSIYYSFESLVFPHKVLVKSFS
ncbi:MAG: Mov34/MPN/PAD-1 family protein [Leptospiraceae bacterium]|nr:Mov34/MPN/PAD-1 family protein [Leptospiraceae bacterium]MDW7975741.1 Mov34/MPN/PAD-1 family protein [Leptospiraceae bacterium]